MSSDSTPPETPTLAALGLEKPLPAGASAEDQAAARSVRETAALTWLAVAELQPAPDAVWQGIRSQISPPAAAAAAPARRRRHLTFAYGGWAAAALLALAWWSRSHLSATLPDTASTVKGSSGLPALPPGKIQTTAPSTSGPGSPDVSGLRLELAQLRQRLAAATLQPDIPGLHRPAIVELRPPDAAGGPDAPGGAAARLQQLVTRALQRDLLLRDGIGEDSAIVLERGWPAASWLPTDSGQTIRHLNFPTERWEELGLWKADDQFYDPATSLTWSPAPDGLGYLGSVSPTPPDAAAFTKPRPKEELPDAPKMQAQPSGYLVSEPGSEDATLLLSDLPPVPEGGRQFVIASNADGTIQRYQIAGNGAESPDLAGFPHDSQVRSTSTGVNFWVDSMSLSSLNLSGTFTNFQVIQTTSGGSTPTVLLTGGGPP